MNEKTRAKALASLEGMRQIVRAEMLIKKKYIEDEVSEPGRAQALCGGRRHCAIGSLWVGAGVRPIVEHGYVELPGVRNWHRPDFLRPRAGLRVAYDALNTAAKQFAAKRDLLIDPRWHSAVEGLFEDFYGDRITKRDLLTVIASAKRIVKSA